MVSVQGPGGQPTSNWLFSSGIKYFLQLMSSNVNAYEVVGINFLFCFFGLFEIRSLYYATLAVLELLGQT